ncbi:MAG: FHA domain-containing protein [Thiolinea sp.]
MEALILFLKSAALFVFFALFNNLYAVEQRDIVIDSVAFDTKSQKLSASWWVTGLNNQSVEARELALIVDDEAINIIADLEPKRGLSVCYMLLVDVSRSMLKGSKINSVTQSSSLVNLLQHIVEQKPSQHFMGLMTFAKNSKLLIEPTQDIDKLLFELEKLNFSEPRTELFRFFEDGVKNLEMNCPSSPSIYRRVLLLVTDGIAEDSAFDKLDAVKFALNNKTSVYSIVTRDSDASQIPFYLAEKTGGRGIQLDIPNEESILNIYRDSNSGGRLDAILSELHPNKNIYLKISLANEILEKSLPVALVAIPSWKLRLIKFFPWLTLKQTRYVMWLAIYLFTLLLILLGWLFYRHFRPNIFKKYRNPIGFLVHQGQAYPIFAGINTIGYLPTNDIVIKDETVGRTHATLHYKGEGVVMVNDLNSLNGSWLNNRRIDKISSVKDGDFIAFGNWSSIFQKVK